MTRLRRIAALLAVGMALGILAVSPAIAGHDDDDDWDHHHHHGRGWYKHHHEDYVYEGPAPVYVVPPPPVYVVPAPPPPVVYRPAPVYVAPPPPVVYEQPSLNVIVPLHFK